jgi:DNA adenine methylase
MPLPFIKWAGGKRTLVPIIANLFPKDFDPSKNRFYEPMVGGGALMLALGDIDGSHMYVAGKKLVINDVNPILIETYKVIRDSVEELISELELLSNDLSAEAFERVKNSIVTKPVEVAARFIYLNKTCFNGLWRVNGSGKFNVPWGQNPNASVFDAEHLRSVSLRLRGAQIRQTTYIAAIEDAKAGDLVYLDPPYIPLSLSASFSKYQKDNFGLLDHHAMSAVVAELTERGVRVILSNSDTAETRRIFGKVLTLYGVSMRRSIGASSASRTKVQEVLAFNYPIDSDIVELI